MGSKHWWQAALLAACLGTGLSANAQTQIMDRVVAIVDNDAVMASALQERLAAVQAGADSNQPLPPQEQLQRQILDALILESLQLQMAERAGVRISDDQLNETLSDIARSNNLTLEQFSQALEERGQSYAQAREQIRREMLLKRVQQGNVSNKVRVSEQEVDTFLASEYGKRMNAEEYRLSHLMLEVPEDAPTSTQQAARDFMEQLKRDADGGASFTALSRRAAPAGTTLRGGDLGWRRELPDLFASEVAGMQKNDVRGPLANPGALHLIRLMDKRGGTNRVVHQTHVRHILVKPSEIRTPAETAQLAQSLHQRLQKGEDFAALARQFSEDPGSKLSGGDLGWTQAGQMVPEFEQVMNSTQAKQISQPFESRFGWHILQVLDHREQDMAEESLRNQARNVLFRKKYDEELQSWLRKIRDEAYVEVKL